MKINNKFFSVLRCRNMNKDDIDYVEWLENELNYEQFKQAMEIIKELYGKPSE